MDDEFEIEVIESRRFMLRINPMYTRLAADLHRSSASMNTDEKKHVQQYVGRAKLFIANINQRRQTMFMITTCIVERQRAYLDHGIRSLQPLSRAGIAEQLGIHESTVSRATASKYALLPNGEVIPYSRFSTPSLSVKDIMKEGDRQGRQAADRSRHPGATEVTGDSHCSADCVQIPRAAGHPAQRAALVLRRAACCS